MDEFEKESRRLFMERISMLQERLAWRETQIEILKEDIERLKTLVANPPVPSPHPLYVSEHEEDIAFARKAQAISIAEAEDMLRELDFENSEIVLDEPDSDLALF